MTHLKTEQHQYNIVTSSDNTLIPQMAVSLTAMAKNLQNDFIDQKPEYQPSVLHFAGVPFKPWKAGYPVFPERFQRSGDTLRELAEFSIVFDNDKNDKKYRNSLTK